MSVQYDLYLEQHRSNVRKGYEWLREHIPSLFTNGDYERQICVEHDQSKDLPDEYDAYDAYFYGGNKSYAIVNNFNEAWLKHIHRNPHHWQHWILIQDDADKGTLAMDMPLNYVIEMICDWWAFSWKSGDLYEIFSWYQEREARIQFSDRTRLKVEAILSEIKALLDEGKGTDV